MNENQAPFRPRREVAKAIVAWRRSRSIAIICFGVLMTAWVAIPGKPGWVLLVAGVTILEMWLANVAISYLKDIP